MCGSFDFKRLRGVTAGVCLAVASRCGQIFPAAAQSATIVVDTSTTVGVSDSGDDLATLQNIFQGANAPQDGSLGDATDPRRPIISDLKMKRMRILQGDTYCDLDVNGTFGNRPLPDANGNYPAVVPGDCDLVKWQIDGALLSGLSPHVAVGYSLPVSFANLGPAATWPTATLLRYQSYALQLVKYVAQRSFDGGASSVVFEVSNELDIADGVPAGYQAWLDWLQQCSSSCSPSDNPVVLGFAPLGPWGRAHWWWDTSTFQLNYPDIWGAQGYPSYFPPAADQRRVTRGIGPMQKIFAAAVAKAQADYPGKTIEIAGPAFAGSTFTRAEDPSTHANVATLEEQFLDYMFDPNSGPTPSTKLDHVSFHYYGDFRNGWSGATTTLKYMTGRLRAKLATSGHPGAKLFLSEWGPTTEVSTDINYSHKGAAWAAAFLTEAIADHITMGSYLALADAVGADPGKPGEASLLHKAITNGVAAYYPKPVANVFKMFAMMKGMRKAVTLPTANPNLGAFAASDANSAGVVIFNYDYSYAFADKPQTFSVELNNLPLNGVVTVERYLVDANTSNLKAFLTQPGQPDPGLQKVEHFSAQVNNGQLVLPSRTLGLGVTFWRILG
jgi:hypothetical protein